MREIETHRDGAVNDKVRIVAMNYGPGGAPDLYDIEAGWAGSGYAGRFRFAKAGETGLTNEVLLAVVADRLAGFQAGPYACEENREALPLIETALELLKGRTARRIAQGTEDKMAEQPRIRLDGDKLHCGDAVVPVSPLKEGWSSWSINLYPAIKGLRPLRADEWAVLEEIAADTDKNSAARRGLTELKQVMAQQG